MTLIEVVHPVWKCSICGERFDNFCKANNHEETAHQEKGYFIKGLKQ